MSDVFAPHMETVAKHFLGEPNKSLSGKGELRYGNHGSVSVDLAKGTWFDHEAGAGGGVLALVEREVGRKGGDAVEYLRADVGLDIPDDRPQAQQAPKTSKLVQTYDYVNCDGEIVIQVCRYEPKTFRQRRPDPSARDGWSWSVKGIEPVPYRLIDILNLEGRGTVFVVEGEKDADAICEAGFVATCNAGGAGKWTDGLSHHLGGLDVVIVPDNDEAGEKHANIVAASVKRYANSVRVLRLPNLPPKGDVSDWIAAGNDAADLAYIASQHAKVWLPEPPKSAFGAIRWCDMDTVAVRQDWLVEDMLFCGDAALMFGASGSGKSFLAVDLAFSVARGEPFLGKKTAQGPVLYQAGEGGKGLVKRMKAYRQHYSLYKEDPPFVLLPEAVNLFSDEGDVQSFIDECCAWKAYYGSIALVVIDTFSTASTGANENDSADMGRMLAAGQAIQKATGAAVLWVHHKNASGERERGHTSLRANMDSAIEVTRDPETNERSLRLVKIKDGEDGEKLGFELQSVQIGAYDDGKPMTSCVVRPAQVGDERTSKKKPGLSPGQKNFLVALDASIQTHGGIMPSLNRTPSNTYGVEWSHFTAIYRSMYGASMDDAALRQAWKRDGDALIQKGMIDRDFPWVWLTPKAEVL